MSKCKMIAAAIGLAMGASSFSAHAVTLYANSDFNAGDTLYRIDTVAMTTTLVGGTDVGANFGLADRNGNLYGFDQISDIVKQIDPNTGATLNSFNVGINAVGEGAIAFNSAGAGFLVEGGSGDAWTFDVDGLTSVSIGSLSPGFDGADYNSGDVLYGLSQNDNALYTIDTMTGMATLVGATSFSSSSLSGLTFDDDDNLFAITSEGDLYSVNAGDASSTLLFNTGLTEVSGLTALNDVQDPDPIPEPGTLALFGLGLIGLGFARRRKSA